MSEFICPLDLDWASNDVGIVHIVMQMLERYTALFYPPHQLWQTPAELSAPASFCTLKLKHPSEGTKQIYSF